MNSLPLDVAVALRFLFHRKAAFLVIVLTIGFALAANTTAFSVVHGFLFASLAIPHSDRVVVVSTTKILPGRGVVDFSDAFPNYRLLRETIRSFSKQGCGLILTTGGTGIGPRDVTPEAVRGIMRV